MTTRLMIGAAMLALLGLPLGGCYIGPAGRIHPAVVVAPAPVYVRPPPPVVVVPRPYGY